MLVTNLQGNVSQLEGRIINQILEVKGLTGGYQRPEVFSPIVTDSNFHLY